MMLHVEDRLTLAIRGVAVAEGGGLRVTLQWNGEPLGEERRVSLGDYQRLHRLTASYRRHLIRPGHAAMAQDTLRSVGTELFAFWLEPWWEALLARCSTWRPMGSTRLEIVSDHPELLLEPWELLLPAGDEDFLGLRPDWEIRRWPTGVISRPRCCPVLPFRPLRVLGLISSPPVLAPLPVAAEWAGLQGALAGSGRKAHLRRTATGSWEALAEGIRRYQPQLVHLIGHGVIHGDRGFFCFEDGDNDPRSGRELVNDLLRRSGVQCLVVSGRSPGEPPPAAALQAICREVTAGGLPLALSWPETLAETIGADFAEGLYTALAAGDGMDRAIITARLAIRAACDASGYPGWTLASLFAAGDQALLFNVSPHAPEVMPEP